MNQKKTKCLICGKENLSYFNNNQFIFLKTTPVVFRHILREKGKGYRSHFYLCYNCIHSNETKLKMLLKKKHFIIRKDFLDFRGGDVLIKIYWFTIKLGDTYIFDRKTQETIMKKTPFFQEHIDSFIYSIIDEVWSRI